MDAPLLKRHIKENAITFYYVGWMVPYAAELKRLYLILFVGRGKKIAHRFQNAIVFRDSTNHSRVMLSELRSDPKKIC